jgi:hypothetical protein
MTAIKDGLGDSSPALWLPNEPFCRAHRIADLASVTHFGNRTRWRLESVLLVLSPDLHPSQPSLEVAWRCYESRFSVDLTLDKVSRINALPRGSLVYDGLGTERSGAAGVAKRVTDDPQRSTF